MAGQERTPLTPQQVGAIKVMVGNKKSNRDIATSLGLKKITVTYAAATARRSGGPAQKQTRGLPKLLSERELRGLHRVAQDNPFASMAEIAEKVHAERAKTAGGGASRPVSFKTLCRVVKGLGLASCAPAKKTLCVGCQQGEAPELGQSARVVDLPLGFRVLLGRELLSGPPAASAAGLAAVRGAVRVGQSTADVQERPRKRYGAGGLLLNGADALVPDGWVYERPVLHPAIEDAGVPLPFVPTLAPPTGPGFQEDLAPCHTAKKCKMAKQALGLKVLP